MNLSELLDRFRDLSVCVAGDVMLDEYLFGRASRISPEAPVMVIRQESRRCVPGGAANVALNVAALGASATVVGVAGEDDAGADLAAAIQGLPVTDGLVYDSSRPTTRKTRVVADHSHQVLRVDREMDTPVEGDLEARLVSSLAKWTGSAVLLSDYRKGVLTPAVVAAAVGTGVPVFANAKPESAGLFAGAELVSLNRSEASARLGRSILSPEAGVAAARELRALLGTRGVVVTLGDQGLAVSHDDGELTAQAPLIEAYDVAGAGDSTIATIALGMTAVGFQPSVFRLAVEVGARVVRHVGVVPPSKADLDEIRALR